MPVTLGTSAGGLPTATLTNAQGASVEVHLQGAHVGVWRTASGHTPLYVSPATVYAEGKAIRGGVPVCWPQFSDMGPIKSAHGFARNSMWDVVGNTDGDSASQLELKLVETAAAGTDFAGAELRYVVDLRCDELAMTLKVTNGRADPIKFTTALHTYFSVERIEALAISGVLDSVPYADNLQQRQMQPPAPIHSIGEEVDRIYHGSNGKPVVLANASSAWDVAVSADGLNDTVLWNPWIEKAKRLADLPDDGYKQFVCVESAAIAEPVTVAAGGTWSGSQVVTLRARSNI